MAYEIPKIADGLNGYFTGKGHPMTNDKMHAAMKDGKLKRGGDFNQDECWGYERGFSDAWQAATLAERERAAKVAERMRSLPSKDIDQYGTILAMNIAAEIMKGE